MRSRSDSNQSRAACCWSSRASMKRSLREAEARCKVKQGGPSMLIALLVPLSLAVLFFSIVLLKSAIAKRALPNGEAAILGAVVAFFDTLGIGSFAPTTAWLKFRKLVPHRLIPPPMVVRLSPPATAQSC